MVGDDDRHAGKPAGRRAEDVAVVLERQKHIGLDAADHAHKLRQEAGEGERPLRAVLEAEMYVLPAVEGRGFAIEEEVVDLELGLAAALLAGKALAEQARYLLRAGEFRLRLDEQQPHGAACGFLLHCAYAGNESLPIRPEKPQEKVGDRTEGLTEGWSSMPERPAAPRIMPASAMNMASASGAK